jgi:hypothetical protein
LRNEDLRVLSDQPVERTVFREFSTKGVNIQPLHAGIRHLHQAGAIASLVRKASTPSIPSSPTVAASTVVPSGSTAAIEMTPPFGKYTY